MSRAEIARYLEERAGKTVYVSELVEKYYADKDLKSPKGSAQNAMWLLINEDKLPIEVVHLGNAWRWVGHQQSAQKGKRLFEEVGSTKSGRIIVEGEDGTLYRLEELD